MGFSSASGGERSRKGFVQKTKQIFKAEGIQPTQRVLGLTMQIAKVIPLFIRSLLPVSKLCRPSTAL